MTVWCVCEVTAVKEDQVLELVTGNAASHGDTLSLATEARLGWLVLHCVLSTNRFVSHLLYSRILI